MGLTSPGSSNLNVPNGLSAARLFLAIVVCVLIELGFYFAAVVCFLIAASTDWIDGWWARRFQQVTKLGRILDPFVDKVIICGAMIALCAVPGSAIAPWMATLVVSRELLVTSLRGLIEGQGGDFSAKQLGKWKMVAQCGAIVSVLIDLQYPKIPPAVLSDILSKAKAGNVFFIEMQSKLPPAWLHWTSIALVWVAILLTILSGLEYILLVVKKPK